jgi:hypothetical protein
LLLFKKKEHYLHASSRLHQELSANPLVVEKITYTIDVRAFTNSISDPGLTIALENQNKSTIIPPVLLL